jgi:hypothetical protein
MSHISGQDFDVMVGDFLVHVESLSATITDNRKAVMTGGIPDGNVNGDVSCGGEIEVDTKNFNLIIESAGASGSFRELEPFDVICIAKVTGQELKTELFGCLLTISDLLNIDPKGGEKTKHKLPFQVTSPDFVRINGVPYLSANDIRNV